jgi:hypothetical protein
MPIFIATGYGPTRPERPNDLYPVVMLGVLVPQHLGWLEVIFLGLLLTLVALVGLFAMYVIVQQFRNPARPLRR